LPKQIINRLDDREESGTCRKVGRRNARFGNYAVISNEITP
jgi:hypothetical protein